MNTLTLSVQNETTPTTPQPVMPAPAPTPSVQLVDGPALLELLFPDEKCRPTLRWLRDRQKKREIPYVKLGRLVFFVPSQVQEALAKNQIKLRG